MDNATWKAWEATSAESCETSTVCRCYICLSRCPIPKVVYEAALGEESWSIYQQMEEGLDCVFSLELLHESLWALKPNLPQTQALPREARRDELHLSLCFEREATPNLLEAVRAAWHGRIHCLKVYRRGASMYICKEDPVNKCPHIAALHAMGRYADRELHISF